jgi:hypothetical protein
VLAAACGGRISGVTDGSVPNDPPRVDAGSFDACPNCPRADSGIDAGPPPNCPTPRDVSGFMPEVLPPPVGKHQNQCTQAQLDLYHKCVVTNDMASCMQIQMQAQTTFKPCLSCLETTSMDGKWGPLVCYDAMTCVFNIEGCVNLATGQSGAMSCGQLLHASYGCQNAACAEQCQGDAQGFSKCVQTALASGCKKYNDAFTMQCGNLNSSDAGFPELINCFRQQGETDSKALRVRIDAYFCGP